jgi:hypothetical protein
MLADPVVTYFFKTMLTMNFCFTLFVVFFFLEGQRKTFKPLKHLRKVLGT